MYFPKRYSKLAGAARGHTTAHQGGLQGDRGAQRLVPTVGTLLGTGFSPPIEAAFWSTVSSLCA